MSNPFKKTANLLLLFLLLLFSSGAPVCVVDGGVLKKRGKDEHETHDKVNIDSFHVGDSGQRRPYSGTNCCHRQNSRDT